MSERNEATDPTEHVVFVDDTERGDRSERHDSHHRSAQTTPSIQPLHHGPHCHHGSQVPNGTTNPDDVRDLTEVGSAHPIHQRSPRIARGNKPRETTEALNEIRELIAANSRAAFAWKGLMTTTIVVAAFVVSTGLYIFLGGKEKANFLRLVSAFEGVLHSL
jgi:hypothetical protein